MDRESFDGYSIGSIGAESAPRGINTERSSIPLIPLTMGKTPIINGQLSLIIIGLICNISHSANLFHFHQICHPHSSGIVIRKFEEVMEKLILKLAQFCLENNHYLSNILRSHISAQSVPVEIPSPPKKSTEAENDDSGFAASGMKLILALVAGKN